MRTSIYSVFLFFAFVAASLYAKGLKGFNSENDLIQVYSLVQQMPAFKNGSFSNFETFINSQIKYPLIAKQRHDSGTVWVEFVVDIDGRIKQIQIKNQVSPALDFAAYILLKNATGWSPGLHEGLPVPVKMKVPVNFVLNDNTPIDSTNSLDTYAEFQQKAKDDLPLHELNELIAKFKQLANNPGWYSCNNSFKYFEKKVVNVDISASYESVYAVFNTPSQVLKNAPGKYNEKEELKELLKLSENKEIQLVGLKILGGKTYWAHEKIIPRGQDISLNYILIENENLEDLLIRYCK